MADYIIEVTFTTKTYIPMDTAWGAKLKAREMLEQGNVRNVVVIDRHTGEVLDINDPEPRPIVRIYP